MKLFSVFDAYASSYEVRDAVAELKNVKGVKSAEVMERAAGEAPRYCVEYNIEDEGAEDTIARLRKAADQYSSYISNHSWGAYKKIG
jgi:hypothetical protein